MNEKKWQVEENFVDRNGATLQSSNNVLVTHFLDYVGYTSTSMPKITVGTTNYVYIGYELDNSGVLVELSSTSTHPEFIEVTQAHSVKYVFGVEDPKEPDKELTHKVTQKSVNRAGTVLATFADVTLPSTTPFTGAPAATLTHNTDNYLYLDYSLDGVNFIAGNPSIASVTQDTNIIYRYGLDKDGDGSEDTLTVSEKFEHRNGTQLLSPNIQTVNMHDTYQGTPAIIPGNVYVGYKVDDGDFKSGTPTLHDINTDVTLTYIYGSENPDIPGTEFEYDVTVHFINRIGGEVHKTNTFKVPADTDHTFIPDVIPGYVYLGYRLDNGDMNLGIPTVTITSVSKDIYLEFMYGVEDPEQPNVELVFNVLETYVDEKGKEIAKSTSTDVIALLPYSMTPSKIDGYDYVGYRIISTKKTGRANQNNVVAGYPNIASLNEYIRVEYVYKTVTSKDATNKTEPKTGIGNQTVQYFGLFALSTVSITIILKRKKKRMIK